MADPPDSGWSWICPVRGADGVLPPQGFFFETALLIGAVALSGAALTALVGWLLQRSRSAAAVRRALRGQQGRAL